MNIEDYIAEQKDVPFTDLPFNEVDNGLLSELAYMDFGGVFHDTETMVSIGDVTDRYFAEHSAEQIRKEGVFWQLAPLLLLPMKEGVRFRDIKVSHYVNDVDAETNMQFAAMVFHLTPHLHFVAYRGTDTTLVGWKESLLLSTHAQIAGAHAAVRYLEHLGKELEGDLLVGGHSKGGYFAMMAATCCDGALQSRIQTVYNNDGPGLHEDLIFSEGYQNIREKILTIVPESSVIGQLFFNEGEHHVVKSNAKGIVQHDLFSWQVEDSHFVPAELSQFSRFVQSAMGNWLEKVDEESRASIIDTVFTLLESTGSEDFHEIATDALQSAQTVFKGLMQLPEENRNELLGALQALIGSSGTVVLKSILS